MTKKTRNILILVVVIPLVGIGIFAVRFLFNVHGMIEHSRMQAAQNGIKEIHKAAQIYLMKHNGRTPNSIEDLIKDGTDDNPPVLQSGYKIDPWQTPYRFEKNGKAWSITSAGPDRKFDTKDDVTSKE